MRHLISVIVVLAGTLVVGHQPSQASHPNIVYILADDLGIGDVKAFNSDGKIPTPSIDSLAASGMKFTDAHSGSAVCTPTRYGVLTGRYAWRTRLQSGVLWGYSLPLIREDRVTVPSLLKEHGYQTACVGKWHLGLRWGLKDDSQTPPDHAKVTWENIDFEKPIRSGPLQVGFDHFYGISASLDMHPYVYIRDDRVTSVPERIVQPSGGMKFWRGGPIGDDFRHIDVLNHLTDRAVDFIASQDQQTPYFLYFPLPAPHKPIIPSDAYQDRSGLNPWGDFVMQVDATVGRVMDAVKASGSADNTLFIVTSDNGATPGADFEALGQKGHDPSGPYRGNKADIYEGGHRVAFVARWPGVIPAGSTCDQTICHTDLLATVAEIVDAELPADAGEDSFSMMSCFQQDSEPSRPRRTATVHHSVNGSFAIRRGDWKLALCPGSGGWSDPRPQAARAQNRPMMQLFNLQDDLGETENVAAEHPEMVDSLSSLLEDYVQKGRSTPGPRQSNDVEVHLLK